MSDVVVVLAPPLPLHLVIHDLLPVLYLQPASIAIEGNIAFVEWEMGLKIKGIEFIYPGTSRLLFNDEGKVCDHRDYFDFVGPTFEPVPVVGSFVRWVYKRFVD